MNWLLFSRNWLNLSSIFLRGFSTFQTTLVETILVTQSTRLQHASLVWKLRQSMRLHLQSPWRLVMEIKIKPLVPSQMLCFLSYSVSYTVVFPMMNKIPNFVVIISRPLSRNRPLSNSFCCMLSIIALIWWRLSTAFIYFRDPGELVDYLLRLISWFF